MLSRWGVDFEDVNVHGNPAARAEMERLGIAQVPATYLDGRFVHGWNPAQLAELVGVDYDATPALTPAELAQSLDNILYYAQHLVERLNGAQLALKHPRRDRTLFFLAFHIFRLSEAFSECIDRGYLPHEWLVEEPPADLRGGPALASHGEGVRDRLRDWFAAAPEGAFAQTAHTYYGDHPAHLLLERTAWHAGQHLRQIYDLLERDGSLPGAPLPPEVFEGLPMPAELW